MSLKETKKWVIQSFKEVGQIEISSVNNYRRLVAINAELVIEINSLINRLMEAEKIINDVNKSGSDKFLNIREYLEKYDPSILEIESENC